VNKGGERYSGPDHREPGEAYVPERYAYAEQGPAVPLVPDPEPASSASYGAPTASYGSPPPEPSYGGGQPAHGGPQQEAGYGSAEPAAPYGSWEETATYGVAPAATAPLPVPPAQRVAPASAAPEAYQRASTEQRAVPGDLALDDVLERAIEAGASDLHLTASSPPLLRINGELTPIPDYEPLQPAMLQRVLYAVLTQSQRERFEEELELDFAYSLLGKARFRVNLYRQRESLGAAFRRIPYEIKSLEQLGIPPVVGNFAALPRGMVLVTGPTGSGKSTTLAAIIDMANRTRHDHIMTVEDPIEFLHRHKSCMVNQREVGEDTHSFANALKHALRQDPDIILVGELRDLETISVALTAAETGHLVFATLHTQDAAQTIDRVIDVFPSHQQQQVRVQLAGTLQGVVCQTLCRTADGRGRVVATEVMVATPAIRNLIREGKTHQVYSALQAGAQHGMHTLDQHLADLVRNRTITYEQGVEKCHHVEDFNRLTGRA
jgi:twitching motility protein PilT